MKKPVILVAAALVLLASLPAFSQAANYPQGCVREIGPYREDLDDRPGLQGAVLQQQVPRVRHLRSSHLVQQGGSTPRRTSSLAIPPSTRISPSSGSTGSSTTSLSMSARTTGATWGQIGASQDLATQFNVDDVPKEF